MSNGLKIKPNSTKLLSLVGGAAIAAATLALTADSASAGTLSFSFETVFNGTSPGGNNGSAAPYATAVFTDVDANTVSLTLTSSLENAAHYISDMTFNFNPLKSLSDLAITQASGSGTLTNPSVTASGGIVKNANNLSLGGSGSTGTGFDIQFNWGSANSGGGIQRFNNTDTNMFTITSASGVSVQDFNYLTSNNRYAGIHVAGINNNQSGAVASASAVYTPTTAPGQAVPEPLTILGAATAAGFGAAFKRRLAKAKDNQKAD
jgi:hypothetical protein